MLSRVISTISIFVKFEDILPWFYEWGKLSLHLKGLGAHIGLISSKAPLINVFMCFSTIASVFVMFEDILPTQNDHYLEIAAVA